MKYLASLGIAIMSLALAIPAMAAPVKFDFRSSSPLPPWTTGDMTFMAGGLSVDVGAFDGSTSRTTVSTNRIAIGSNGSGLVACAGTPGSNSIGCSGDEHTVDSNTGNTNPGGEDIKFTFSEIVRLKSVEFQYWDGTGGDISSEDDFSLFVGGVNIVTDQLAVGSSSNGYASFDFSNLVGGPFDLDDTMFHIGARGGGDTFKLRSLTVEAVPIPDSALLFGTGLLGFIVFARRKNLLKK